MNSHLKTALKEVNNFLNTSNNPPEDLLDNIIMELRVSNLLTPAVDDGDEITFEHLESEKGHKILPLFTDRNEYRGTGELMNSPISFYGEIVCGSDFDGAVVNPDTDRFFLPKDFMKGFIDEIVSDDDGSLEADELKRISREIKNEELVKFIRDDSNFNNYEGLIEKLRGAALLNVVASNENLSEFANDGILLTLQVGGFDLSVRTVGREKYGLLFTSLDKITQTCDMTSDIHYYYQVASLNKLLYYILMNDLDGVILNPGLEEYYIPRNVLLDIYVNHRDITDNPKFYYAIHYAFLLE